MKADALMYMRLAMMPCYAIPFAFLWFVLNLVGVARKRWWLIFAIGIPLIFMIFGFSSLMITDMVPKLEFKFWPVPGPLMHFYIVFFFAIVVLSCGILIRGYMRSAGIQKWQIKWVALSLLPGWLGGATNWCLWYDVPVPPVAHFSIGVCFLVLTYAIIRSRLFDVDAITDLVQEAKLSALGIMATSINHEVRNPLFVIKGLAETLLERSDADPAKIKDIAQRVVGQADRAIEIIRNFSEYAKRQSSKSFDKQPLDIKEVLESIVPLVYSELDFDHIRLQVNIPSKTMICADRHTIEEIFINLIVNACQAFKPHSPSENSKVNGTSPGNLQLEENRCQGKEKPQGGEIEISAKEKKPWLLIKIRDTGPGLSQDQLNRIFEPFYTTKSSGTGLGLYVVKQLVEKNGGRIEAQSRQGIGTTFAFLLPRVPSLNS